MGKKSSTPAPPKPDENIAKAAHMQAELGQEWLEFAKIETSDAKDRQAVLDDMTTRRQPRSRFADAAALASAIDTFESDQAAPRRTHGVPPMPIPLIPIPPIPAIAPPLPRW